MGSWPSLLDCVNWVFVVQAQCRNEKKVAMSSQVRFRALKCGSCKPYSIKITGKKYFRLVQIACFIELSLKKIGVVRTGFQLTLSMM